MPAGILPEKLLPERRSISRLTGKIDGRLPSSIFSFISRNLISPNGTPKFSGNVDESELKARLSLLKRLSSKISLGKVPRILLLVRKSSFSPRALLMPLTEEMPVCVRSIVSSASAFSIPSKSISIELPSRISLVSVLILKTSLGKIPERLLERRYC